MFETMLRRVRGPQPKTQAAYQALVIDIADGKPAPDDLADILDGRSEADFQADVKTLIDRRKAAALLKSPKDPLPMQRASKALADAEKALAEHPLRKLIAEMQQLERNVEAARLDLSSARSSSRPLAEARSFLFRTSATDIDKRMSEVSNKANPLEDQRGRLMLRGSEVDQRAAAEQELAELPSRISKLASADAAPLVARTASLRAMLKGFADRQSAVERLDVELAKIAKDREKIEAERMVPERMAFASTPKPVE